MHPLHTYRIPLMPKVDGAMTPGDNIAPFPEPSWITFKLRTFVVDDVAEHIYECTTPGCRGCGCPPFPAGGGIPAEIEDHLRVHVELCEGLVRSKVPQ